MAEVSESAWSPCPAPVNMRAENPFKACYRYNSQHYYEGDKLTYLQMEEK